MPNGASVTRQPRVDPAGRPLEGRRQQAITSFSILICWICLTLLTFWATMGDGPIPPAISFAGMAVLAWLCAEAFGGKRGLVWPTSALAVIGSLSLGFSVSLINTIFHGQDIVPATAFISGVASVSMTAYLVRFRLPGLVSPIITFAIFSLFLGLYGINGETLSKLEGFSPRGILAVLIGSPGWMALFGGLAAGAVVLARWCDLKGDDFAMASARPLHLIGAGVLALVVGRLIGPLPSPLDLVLLVLLWIGAFVWGLRINRVSVTVAIHAATVKPLVSAIDEVQRVNSLMMWRLDWNDWAIILFAILFADLFLWFHLHKLSLRHGWTLGPGGRIPRERSGWMWRYWPYA